MRLAYGLRDRGIAGAHVRPLRRVLGPGSRHGWPRQFGAEWQRRDDPLPLAGVVVGVFEASKISAPERGAIGLKHSVVDDLSIEWQKHCLAQVWETRTDQILKGVRERQYTVSDDRLAGCQEDGVLLEIVDDAELPAIRRRLIPSRVRYRLAPLSCPGRSRRLNLGQAVARGHDHLAVSRPHC